MNNDVQFDFGEENYTKKSDSSQKTPALIALLVKYGIAKDTKTATYILFGVVVVALIITVMVIL